MNVTLAATWNPRGEMTRLQRLLGVLQQVYEHIVVVSPPNKDIPISGAEAIQAAHLLPGIDFYQTDEWAEGRHTALVRSLVTPAAYIQYADMDRLLRWVETRFDEWRQTVDRVTGSDFLVIGRTPSCYQTHPRSLVETEAISNRVVSHFIGRAMDVSAGSKGFSRAAAEYIAKNASPIAALGTDAQWPILLHQAGFQIDYVEVDGLDWESADRYLDRPAHTHEQKQEAERYDRDPENWAKRVEIANQIVEAAFYSLVR
jgi:hypothetical protein